MTCRAVIYKRDQYRLRRGYGFRMHYARQRCTKPTKTGDLCTQHAKLQTAGRCIERVTWCAVDDVRGSK